MEDPPPNRGANLHQNTGVRADRSGETTPPAGQALGKLMPVGETLNTSAAMRAPSLVASQGLSPLAITTRSDQPFIQMIWS